MSYQLIGFDLLTGKLKHTRQLSVEQFTFACETAKRYGFHPRGHGFFELTDAQAEAVLHNLGEANEEPILWSVEVNEDWPVPA